MDDFDPDELDRVGERLCLAHLERRLSRPDTQSDREVLEAFRASGTPALTDAVAAVRTAADDAGLRGFDVSRRTKQRGTILHKLQRMRDRGRPLGLSEMIDVLGCRIVVEGQSDANLVAERVQQRSPLEVLAVVDYTTQAKRTGYRAIHLHARSQGRLVEVQIRSRRQHEWAQRSEDLQLGVTDILRDGKGPDVTQRYLRALSDVLAEGDAGREPSTRLLDRLGRAERELREYDGLHGSD